MANIKLMHRNFAMSLLLSVILITFAHRAHLQPWNERSIGSRTSTMRVSERSADPEKSTTSSLPDVRIEGGWLPTTPATATFASDGITPKRSYTGCRSQRPSQNEAEVAELPLDLSTWILHIDTFARIGSLSTSQYIWFWGIHMNVYSRCRR